MFDLSNIRSSWFSASNKIRRMYEYAYTLRIRTLFVTYTNGLEESTNDEAEGFVTAWGTKHDSEPQMSNTTININIYI